MKVPFLDLKAAPNEVLSVPIGPHLSETQAEYMFEQIMSLQES
jgi:hypothetical protein